MKNLGWFVLIGVGVLAVAALCLTGIGGGYYNTFIDNENDAREKWSAIETAYQRRADLVSQELPTLVGAAQQELAVFKALRDQAAALSGALNPATRPTGLTDAEVLELIQSFEQAMVNVSVYVADNPEIVSAQLFSDFMVIVEGSENRINIARLDYNESVTTYRNSVQKFPANIFAMIFSKSADQFPYFEAQEGTDQAPEVVFPTPAP